MNWQTISEVCFGLVLEARHPVTLYRPENFASPYDQGIKILLQKGSTKEDVAKVLSSSYLSDASSAVHKFNGLGEYQSFDWNKALVDAQASFERARRFKKLVKKWEENEDVDLLPVYGELQSVVAGESSGLSVASNIDYNHYKPFEKSGNPTIDKILGGFPSDGPIIVYGLTGVGKCLAKGTKVLMFDGTTQQVEDIMVGDWLMGPDSNPRIVRSLAHGWDDMYKVTPTKGEPYTVNSEHILSLRYTNNPDKRYSNGDIVNISVLDYLKSSNQFKHIAKGWRTGVEFNEQNISIDPYFLGLWLGDGESTRPMITSIDQEIINYLYEFAADEDYKVGVYRQDGFMISSGIPGITNKITENLKELEVIRNKHIPYEYKSNSRNIRLNILAGLLDTDGSYYHGCFDFISKYETLSDDVIFVARSLGLAAYKTECKKTCYNNMKEGTYYRVCISGNIDEIPTRIARKQATERKQKKNVLNTGISVDYIGYGEYFGFDVDKDGLFLLGDFTVTHNSHWLASTMDYLLHQYPNKKGAIYTLEMSAEHYLWRETNMYPSIKEVLERLYVSGSVRDIDELVAEVMSGKFDYVGLDDMDNIVKSSDASEYERVYRRVKEVCRFMKIPFFVLCQPNRAAKLDSGNRFLGPYDVAWSGSAENSAALLIALQKTTSTDMKTEMFPTDDDPLYYSIFWKSRDGWPGDYSDGGQIGPGAIILRKGKQSWRGEVYAGKYKLWTPGSSNISIGKKRTKE